MRTLALFLAAVLTARTAHAQFPGSPPPAPPPRPPAGRSLATLPQTPAFGSVPDEKPSGEVLPLSLADAIHRALDHNLAVLATEYGVDAARGARWRALSDLMPSVSARAAQTEQELNLAAFGFPPPAGGSSIVGPFSVIDARVFLTQALVDFRALNDARAQGKALDAAKLQAQNARELVVLVAADLYSQVIAMTSRAEAAHAQLTTAERVHRRSIDLKEAGLIAGIDVLRAQVQMETQRSRAIAADNDVQKAKLQLARAIGLAAGQAFTLSDNIPYAPLDGLTIEDALARAYRSRSDYLAAQALVEAAQAERRAASAERWPSLQLNADYGDIGPTLGNSHSTFSVTASVRVPVFDASRTVARSIESQSQLRQRQADLADLKGRVDFEVRTAFLDLNAAAQQVAVATTARDLADQQLAQAQDRYAAGVAGGLEVVQAQEAVATANETYISSVYAHNLAKGAVARALGIAEASVAGYLKGSR